MRPPPPRARGPPVAAFFLLLLATTLAASTHHAPPPPTLDDAPAAVPLLPAYNELTAKAMADFCAAAYACGSFQGCGKWHCTSCLLHPNTEILRFHGTDKTNTTGITGFVAHDPDLNKVILAFAGTQPGDLVTWAGNVDGELMDYPPCVGCQVHTGFMDDYRGLEKAMKEAVGYVLGRFPSSGLWVTGHSLGGALAMLAAADLHTNHSTKVEAVYTFGQPRVGNQAFAMNFKESLVRLLVVYHRVTHPPTCLPYLVGDDANPLLPPGPCPRSGAPRPSCVAGVLARAGGDFLQRGAD